MLPLPSLSWGDAEDRQFVRATYATTAECIEEWLIRECDEEATLGFDTETRPAFRKGEVHPPATLQLSTATATLVVPLLHLDAPPALLLDTLASTHIAKVGVGIDDDAIELWLHHGARLRHSKRRPRLRLSALELGYSVPRRLWRVFAARLGRFPCSV